LRFFAWAFGWSWTCWFGAALLKNGSAFTAGGLEMLGGFGPGIAAVVVVAHGEGRSGLHRWLLRCLQWRVGWLRVLLAFIAPALLMGLALVIHGALGGTIPDSPARGHVWLAALNFILVFLIGGPLGEEFGWRGYALPAMQARWGWRKASLTLGVVWATWHLPLFLSSGTVQSHLPFGLYAASAVASSVVFAWLYNQNSGSVLPVLVLHTAVNAWFLIIPVMVMPEGSNLRPFQLVVGLLVLVAATLLMPGRKKARTAADPGS
jgi:membrane protease YdiL (CAAX protease family)